MNMKENCNIENKRAVLCDFYKETAVEEFSNVYTMASICEKEPLIFLRGDHWSLKTVKLHAFSDENDTLCETGTRTMFAHSFKTIEGNMFFFTDMESGDGVFVVSEAPDFQKNLLCVKNGVLSLSNGGNPCTVGFAPADELEKLCKAYYRKNVQNKIPLSMSNTWGDMNGFSRVCEDFMMREIDSASEIGIDVVQIDDGWQLGNTADKVKRDEFGRRYFWDGYWEINDERFPHGIIPVYNAARDRGLKLGLWFAPESHDLFSKLDRDIDVLRRAYFEWGVRYFKLDMYYIENNEAKDKFLQLLKAVKSFGDDVSVQLDVTRDMRVNYLTAKEYGTVFVENRYTKGANSFPHRVLRNLWNFSNYLPTVRFLFEIVNPDLNVGSYSESDPFSPVHYSMDYLFAIVMTANPLFWMELQFLSDKRRSELKPLMEIWKEWRKELYNSDVIPVGEVPSGRSLTGFRIETESAAKYLLLFREVTERTEMFLDSCGANSCEIICSNGLKGVDIFGSTVRVEFSGPRQYALIKLLNV